MLVYKPIKWFFQIEQKPHNAMAKKGNGGEPIPPMEQQGADSAAKEEKVSGAQQGADPVLPNPPPSPKKKGERGPEYFHYNVEGNLGEHNLEFSGKFPLPPCAECQDGKKCKKCKKAAKEASRLRKEAEDLRRRNESLEREEKINKRKQKFRQLISVMALVALIAFLGHWSGASIYNWGNCSDCGKTPPPKQEKKYVDDDDEVNITDPDPDQDQMPTQICNPPCVDSRLTMVSKRPWSPGANNTTEMVDVLLNSYARVLTHQGEARGFTLGKDIVRAMNCPDGVHPNDVFLAALIAKESRGDPRAVGDGGASQGILQFQKDRWHHIYNNIRPDVGYMWPRDFVGERGVSPSIWAYGIFAEWAMSKKPKGMRDNPHFWANLHNRSPNSDEAPHPTEYSRDVWEKVGILVTALRKERHRQVSAEEYYSQQQESANLLAVSYTSNARGATSTPRKKSTAHSSKATIGDLSNFYQNPVPGSTWNNKHWDGKGYAVDMMAKKGTPVYASASGKVIKAGWGGDRSGKRVTIRDQYADNFYGHLDAIYVSVGQKVQKGQMIGRVGHTGNAKASAPHLHYEVSNRKAKNFPKPWIRWAQKQHRT